MKDQTVYALGFFDGVHVGHQALLAACRELSGSTGAAPGVITFSGHPQALISGQAPLLINSIEDRRALLAQYGMEKILTIPFDRALMQMPWQDFFRRLVEQYGAGALVCGDDFRFGYRGEGTSEKLQQACREMGIPCRVVSQQTVDGVRVSSTHIRSLLQQGHMEQAVRFLGHPHILSGKVVSGRQLGRTMGIPTANVSLPQGVVLPAKGVYACMATAEGNYMAVTNVGSRPTVGGHRVTVEPWLLDFQGNLYDKTITLCFHKFLRPEKTFGSIEELKEEIQKNAQQTRDFFEKN